MMNRWRARAWDAARGRSRDRAVQEAGTGARPCEQIREERPDLVFLDVQMPEMDGFAVMHEIGGSRCQRWFS